MFVVPDQVVSGGAAESPSQSDGLAVCVSVKRLDGVMHLASGGTGASAMPQVNKKTTTLCAVLNEDR
jgi:hypothetical protein